MIFLFFQWPAMRVKQPLEGSLIRGGRPNPGKPVEYIIHSLKNEGTPFLNLHKLPGGFLFFPVFRVQAKTIHDYPCFIHWARKKPSVICCFFLRDLQIILPSHIRFKKPFFSDPPQKKPSGFPWQKQKIHGFMTLRIGNVALMPWNTCRVWCLVVAAMYLGCRKQKRWVLEQPFFMNF